MTSLTDVYDEEVRTVAGRRRRLFGMGLFAVGTLCVVAGIALATTALSNWLGLDLFAARQTAGVLAGLGMPAAVLGVFAVLPASGTTRGVAAIGASLAGFGVVLFTYAYPYNWLANSPGLALGTTVIYTLGMLVTFWCLFVGVATFKTRSDPGGTARLEITEEGKIRVISTSPSLPDFNGGVGLFGRDPDGGVPTQTKTDQVSTPDGDDAVVMAEPTSDGGTAVADEATADPDLLDAVKQRGRPDEYCGNCEHFDYVRADGELTPYCGLTDELMEDMDACDDWSANN